MTMAEDARTELVGLLEQAFFVGDATTGLEHAIEALAAIEANPDVVLRALTSSVGKNVLAQHLRTIGFRCLDGIKEGASMPIDCEDD